jgi:hypothetical protein
MVGKKSCSLLMLKPWGSPCIYIRDAEATRDEQSCRQEESHPLTSMDVDVYYDVK